MAKTKSYSRLFSSDDPTADLPSQGPPQSYLRRHLCYIAILLGMLCVFAFGFFLGSRDGYASRDSTIEPAGNLHYYMHFNGSFPQRSNTKTNALWDSLFPEKLGFVQHPELSPNVAGIAVFHELHCLNILRTAFFASVDGVLEEMGNESHEKNDRTSHHHIRHCFEYLRQSLICLADSNLEAMNYTTQGVSGWQTERTCRDFEKLKLWADNWGISREDALHNWNLTNS